MLLAVPTAECGPMIFDFTDMTFYYCAFYNFLNIYLVQVNVGAGDLSC